MAASREPFSRRLGEWIDLSASVGLAEVQGRSPALPDGASEASAETLRAEFLRRCRFIVESALQTFVPGGTSTRIRLPLVDSGGRAAVEAAREPHLRFYAANQREIEFRIRTLHARVREGLSALSPELARLAMLDAALGEIVSAQSRRLFASIPRLLGKRYDRLLEGCANAAGSAGEGDDPWLAMLDGFRWEMREVLLAECETRLLPVTGLIEAMESVVDETDR